MLHPVDAGTFQKEAGPGGKGKLQPGHRPQECHPGTGCLSKGMSLRASGKASAPKEGDLPKASARSPAGRRRS